MPGKNRNKTNRCALSLWGKLDARSTYLWGIGVGLIISWVTSAIAYLKNGLQPPLLLNLILLELALSVIFMLTAYFINTKKNMKKT